MPSSNTTLRTASRSSEGQNTARRIAAEMIAAESVTLDGGEVLTGLEAVAHVLESGAVWVGGTEDGEVRDVTEPYSEKYGSNYTASYAAKHVVTALRAAGLCSDVPALYGHGYRSPSSVGTGNTVSIDTVPNSTFGNVQRAR